MYIQQNIRHLRLQKKWSQKDLSHQLKVGVAAVSAWEKGRNLPASEKLVELSKIFDVSLDHLFFALLAKGELEPDQPYQPGIPVYLVSGKATTLGGEGSDSLEYIQLPGSKNRVAIKVSSNNAYPELSKGDIAICEKSGQSDLSAGRLWFLCSEAFHSGFYRMEISGDMAVLSNNQTDSFEILLEDISEAYLVVQKLTEEGLL